MKYSYRKKAKIHKQKQRRINKYCKNMIGSYVDVQHFYEVKDQARIKGEMYLLVKEDEQYAIYKMVKVGEAVKLSEKKVLQKEKALSNHVYWKLHSTIQINAAGEVESIKLGNYAGPYNMRPKHYNTGIRIYV